MTNILNIKIYKYTLHLNKYSFIIWHINETTRNGKKGDISL